MKPCRRRAYLFITRVHEGRNQVLVFHHADPELRIAIQTPGGSMEPDETPTEAALREAREETGLTLFESVRLIAEDESDRPDEVIHRFFFHLPLMQEAPELWEHQVGGGGIDGGMIFKLWWADLPEAMGLDPHFADYLDRIG